MNFFSYFISNIWGYVFFLLILLLCLPQRYNKGKYAYLAAFVVIFIFSAFRYDVGWDYSLYVSNYMKGDLVFFAFDQLEPFSKILLIISRNTGFYQFFFIINALITTFCIYSIIRRYSVDIPLSIIVYVCVPLFYLISFSLVRQMTAVAIIFFAYQYVFEKKAFKFIVAIFVATMFHYSAIIAVILFPLYLLRFNRNIHVILFIVSFFLTTLVSSIVLSMNDETILIQKLQYYIRTNLSGGFQQTWYLVLAFGIFNFIMWNKLVKMFDNGEKLLSIYNFGIIIGNVLLPFGHVGPRSAMFFLISLILIYPMYCFLFKRSQRVLMRQLSISFALFLFFYTLFTSAWVFKKGINEKDQYLPYEVFFLKDYDKFVPVYDQ